jgi:hypothetical protein
MKKIPDMKKLFNWKVVLTFLLVICNLMVIFGSMPSTNPIIGWYDNDITGNEEYEVLIVTNDNQTYIKELDVSYGMATLYIPEEYTDIKSLTLTGDVDILNDSKVVLSSRDIIIYRDDIKADIDDNELTLKNSQFKKIQFLLMFDWRVKLEVLTVIWFVYICIMIFGILREKNKLNLKCIGTVILTLLLIGSADIIKDMDRTYETTNLNLNTSGLTDIIKSDSDMLQKINTDKNLQGVSVRFATYSTEIKGKYIFTLYDADKNPLENVEVRGRDFVDNEYGIAMFNNIYPKGEYYFGIAAQDNNDDTLSAWTTGGNDYKDGAFYNNGIDTGVDLDFNIIVGGPNTKVIAMIIVLVFYLLVLMVIWHNNIRFLSRITVKAIYGITFVYAVFMMIFAWKYMYLGAYDEMAHISYLADLTKNPHIVSEYENQNLLVGETNGISETTANTIALHQSFGTFKGKWSNTVSYLGHPSLYYWLMIPLNAVTFHDNLVYVNLDILRIFNMVLVAMGIALFLYIGYSRINKRYPALHLMYAMMVVSFPMLTGCAPMINNDNLSILVVAIFTLGIIRFAENKRNKLTYFLIAIGITASALTKLTTCLMLVICALFFVVKTIMEEKDIKKVFGRNFWYTLPVYLIAAAYYLFVFVEYGKIQISLHDLVTDEVFKTYNIIYKEPIMRTRITFYEFIKRFEKGFINQWIRGVTWHTDVDFNKKTIRLAYEILWLSPIIMLIRIKYKENEKQIRNFFKSFSIALIITVLMQFIRAFKDFQFISGHPGLQSRYYICVMPVMVMMLCYELQSRMEENKFITSSVKNDKKIYLNSIFNAIAITLALLALYGGGLIYIFFTTSFIK